MTFAATPTRRRLAQAGLALAAAPALARPALARPALAQANWPSRPITLVIGYAPGGLTDVMVRMVAERLGRELGQTVVVENRSGGGTSIASTYVAQARPDGYTLLIGTNSLAINPALQPGSTPRDPLKELQPIGLVYYSPFAMAVQRSVPVEDLAGLVAYAKANPGKLNYGSSGNGSVNHLLTELLLQKAGMRVEHVPYRGAGPALLDLRADRIQLFYASPLDIAPLLNDGTVRLVAISAPRAAADPARPALGGRGLSRLRRGAVAGPVRPARHARAGAATALCRAACHAGGSLPRRAGHPAGRGADAGRCRRAA